MDKRRFFQMHLSTAVVLMLVAGVLVWANVVPYVDVSPNPKLEDRVTLKNHGWPFVYRHEILNWQWTEAPDGRYYLEEETDWLSWRYLSGLSDALIALAILLAVWQVCEWRVRRREAK